MLVCYNVFEQYSSNIYNVNREMNVFSYWGGLIFFSFKVICLNYRLPTNLQCSVHGEDMFSQWKSKVLYLTF